MLTTDITATVYTDESPVHASLFGNLRNMVAKKEDLKPYVHPRIVVGKEQWDKIVAMYADPVNFEKQGTYTKFFRDSTMYQGPNAQFIKTLNKLEIDGGTAVYDGREYDDSEEYRDYRNGLKQLAQRIRTTSAWNADTFVVCALWASVALKQHAEGRTPFIPVDTVDVCINAAVAWAKVVLAHRTYYCNPDCPTLTDTVYFSHFWDTTRKFDLDQNWYLGGTGIGFTYDLLYDYINDEQKRIMRSAVAMFVMNRWAWGTTEESTRSSPNAMLTPHRIFSNWAAYNSNLYLANLAIQYEDGFNPHATAILRQNKTPGFNQKLHDRYSRMLIEFMKHSFYPSGGTFEDGYTYFNAMREGSLGLLASHRRGSNVLGTTRFRNAINNAAQMTEPKHCGLLIGHASGGGSAYNAHIALFRYAYPQGELPGMLWRQRFGNYIHNNPCRILWGQASLQYIFLGGEHISDADSPASLKPELKKYFKKSFYCPRRGLLIARSSLSDQATYMHFDARPDAFIVGHDNADRGVFTFTALRQTWMVDLPWRENIDSRKHSIMHIDGLAEDYKAPSVKMLKVLDDGNVVLAAADLTYAYNFQWARGSNYNSPPRELVTTYGNNGIARDTRMEFKIKETSSPWDLGWPRDDKAKDIGFFDGMTLYGVDDVTFMGIWEWKREYREKQLNHIVRSLVLVRSDANEVGYGIIVDSVSAGDGKHHFESYLILHEVVYVDTDSSSCPRGKSTCKIMLKAPGIGQVDIHVLAKGSDLSFRTEKFHTDKIHTRLIIKSIRDGDEEIWMIFHPHKSDPNGFAVSQNGAGHTTITYEGASQTFAVNEGDHSVVDLNSGSPTTTTPPIATPTPLSSSAAPSETTPVSPTPTSAPPSAPSTPLPLTNPVAPMEPITLSKEITIPSQQHSHVFNSERSTFFHKTNAPYQTVFLFRSKTNSRKKKEDRIITCSLDTTVHVLFSVYDCGGKAVGERNYERRDCRLVGDSAGNEFRCKSYRTRFGIGLNGRRQYFLVVDIWKKVGRPVLFLRHTSSKRRV